MYLYLRPAVFEGSGISLPLASSTVTDPSVELNVYFPFASKVISPYFVKPLSPAFLVQISIGLERDCELSGFVSIVHPPIDDLTPLCDESVIATLLYVASSSLSLFRLASFSLKLLSLLPDASLVVELYKAPSSISAVYGFAL